jgi:hypothetical protein
MPVFSSLLPLSEEAFLYTTFGMASYPLSLEAVPTIDQGGESNEGRIPGSSRLKASRHA